MSTTEITNSEDIIDSRDVIARIADLEGCDCGSDREDGEGCDDTDCPTCYEDVREELTALKELAGQASGYAADWQYGEALIRDSYFQTYAMELADDIGAVDTNAGWPMSCIDWEQAARELQMDYTSVEFDGVTYWIR